MGARLYMYLLVPFPPVWVPPTVNSAVWSGAPDSWTTRRTGSAHEPLVSLNLSAALVLTESPQCRRMRREGDVPEGRGGRQAVCAAPHGGQELQGQEAPGRPHPRPELGGKQLRCLEVRLGSAWASETHSWRAQGPWEGWPGSRRREAEGCSNNRERGVGS